LKIEVESISPMELLVHCRQEAIDAEELRKLDAYFRASLYLCLGMLYLKQNPFSKEPLAKTDLKAAIIGALGI